MTDERDEVYIEGMKKWLAGEALTVEVIKNRINFLDKDIELTKKQLEVSHDALEFHSNQLEMATKELETYQENYR